MNHILLSNEYCFLKVHFSKKHYTDNRKGSPFHYIARLMKGTARLRSYDSTISLEEGDVFYIPKGLPYESFWYGEDIQWYSFGFHQFPEAAKTTYRLQKILCEPALKEELSSLPTPTEVNSQSLGAFYTVLAKLLPFMDAEESSGDAKLFQRSKALMEKHLDWSIERIAVECHISYSTLYQIYRKVCAKTPNTIRQELLVERAVFLLSSTDRSVQEISDTLGFSSTSYFRKILQKYTGLTPTRIRQKSNRLV